MSTLTQDQIILGGPWKKEESSSLNYPFRGEEPGPSMPIDGTMTAKIFFLDFLVTMSGSSLPLRLTDMLLD